MKFKARGNASRILASELLIGDGYAEWGEKNQYGSALAPQLSANIVLTLLCAIGR